MKQHELKTWEQYFQAIVSGEKTFELRKNDRDFKAGDILLLREYKLLGLNNITQKIEGEYTGDEISVQITYILNHEPMKNNFGLERGYCVMGIKKIELTENLFLKLGFSYNDLNGDSGYWQIKSSIGIFEILQGESGFYYQDGVEIKYLHELQDLYFKNTKEKLVLAVTPNEVQK